LHAHGAALDVPAGPPFAPWTGPEDGPVRRHTRFPEREVGQGFLGVFVGGDSRAGAHLLEIQIDQLSVAAAAALVFLDAEIDRTVRGLVSDAALHQSVDELDHLT